MSINKYTLKIQNPEIARSYMLSHTNAVFYTGLALTVIRLARLLLSVIFKDNLDQNIYLIP
jgi:hypothetical protein